MTIKHTQLEYGGTTNERVIERKDISEEVR